MSKLAANNIHYSSKSVAEQAGLSLFWSNTLKTDFSCFKPLFKGNFAFCYNRLLLVGYVFLLLVQDDK